MVGDPRWDENDLGESQDKQGEHLMKVTKTKGEEKKGRFLLRPGDQKGHSDLPATQENPSKKKFHKEGGPGGPGIKSGERSKE